MIRIPAARGKATRTEIRSVDTTANPYLAVAVILASGLDAIKNNTKLIEPINDNLFALTPEERNALGVMNLPDNLKEAIDLLKADELMKKTLGEHIFTKFIEYKTKEWDDFRKTVTEWEIKQYLQTN
jgi:glutamine synthetase